MSASPRVCLVVDDSRVVRKVARRILEQQGFTVLEAENGADGLDACRRALPACVLLDWNMPVMDGLTLLKILRAEYGPNQPVVIFCTTERSHEQISQALESGAQDYIMKPFDAKAIIAKLTQVGLL